MNRWCIGMSVALCFVMSGSAQAAGPPTALTVGDRDRPLNVEGTPAFGWMPSSSKGDDVQTAYQLKVTKADGTSVWDSGKVASSAQSYVPYGGPALANGEAYEWSVRTWDRDDEASPTASGRFETGLTDSGWSGAQWIRRVTTGNDSSDDYTFARKEFPAIGTSPVTRARVYAAAMGNYEVHVNGRSIGRGDNFNHPTEAQYYAFDATSAVTAGQPLALGAMYHYWTCTCQGRANGPISNTTLSAPQAAGATELRVGSVGVFDVGDQVTVGTGAAAETATVMEIRTAAMGGPSIRVAPALTQAHAMGQAVLDHAGPSGLIMKAVVDHADGSRETFVSDGTWKISKATQYTNTTLTTRNGDSGDRAERYDARAEIPDWDKAGFVDSAWQPAYAIGPHPRPLNDLRETFSHLVPAISEIEYDTMRPKTFTTLADGSVVVDFGHVMSAMPAGRLQERPRGPAGGRADELPPEQHDALRSRGGGRDEHQGRERRELRRGRQDHRRPGGQRLRQGRSGGPHDHRRGHDRRERHRDHARCPAQPGARERALRRGLARGHDAARHAGLEPGLVVHAEGRRADRAGLHVLGLALSAGTPARRGRDADRRRHRRGGPAPPPPRAGARRSTPTTRRSTPSST